MSHRILHVFSSNFFAGSVAYALRLAERQSLDGHQVIIVTDTEYWVEKCICLKLPVSNRSFLQRFRNILFLKRIIKKFDVNVVHAHSRAASWIAFHATHGTKTSLISTIHGRQVKHYPAKKMDVYGESIISICPNLTEHLIHEIELKPEKIFTIPNGIGSPSEIRTNAGQKRIISVVGRFNGPKGKNISRLMTDVFPFVLRDYGDVYIQLSGSEWHCFPEEGKKSFEDLQSRYPQRIARTGSATDITKLYMESDLVIGAGRVALEALLLKVPVFAIGEACCHGILSSLNIQEAINSNFGDILPAKTDFEPDCPWILNHIRQFLDVKPQGEDLTKWLQSFNFDKVYSGIMDVYRKAIAAKVFSEFIPVLMYHKVPEVELQTSHRIFVTQRKFRMHLKFFRLRGLSAITFKDILAFINGDKPLREFPKKPLIITFDDGYEDNYYNMLPLMKKYGFKGVLFLLGDFSVTANHWDPAEGTDHNRIMLPDQKKAFVESGWEIGAHTLSHPELTGISIEKARQEIVESKRKIEETLHTDVVSFAYPYGKYNQEIKKIVKDSGFQFGISTDTGGMTIEEDPYAVFRINMFPEENMFQLYKKTSKWYRSYYRRKRNK